MLVGEFEFYSCGRHTIALTNMHTDLMSFDSSLLSPNVGVVNLLIYVNPLICILRYNIHQQRQRQFVRGKDIEPLRQVHHPLLFFPPIFSNS